ncbi:SDR family oxidoreductase [Bdellovibrio sp. HCB337]|uniref:SDR family oxidoreductase n=1 Tax=Bdellovibrio sp. HCB337 TaxID=3394358 RepID=UPI0039A58776
MDLQLKNKKVLVMGASTGIGRSIAEVLVQEGAEVAICSRSLDKLQKTAKEIGAKHVFTCDLTKAGEGKSVVEKAIKEMGGVDILVTNTGGPNKGNFADVSDSQWQEDFQSLWMSVVESLKAALPKMKENNYGRVLLVTSLAAKEPLNGLTTSNGLRAGLAGLSKSIANEYAPFGITINLLLPGYTATDRLKELKLTDERIKQMVPAGRLGDPRELADLAAFLASPRAGYITGQSILIDGGVTRGY